MILNRSPYCESTAAPYLILKKRPAVRNKLRLLALLISDAITVLSGAASLSVCSSGPTKRAALSRLAR